MASMTVVAAATREKVGVITWTGSEDKGTFAFEPAGKAAEERDAQRARYDAALKAARKKYARCIFLTPNRDYVYGFDGYWGTALALRLGLMEVTYDIDWNANDPPAAARVPPRDEMEAIGTKPSFDESLATV